MLNVVGCLRVCLIPFCPFIQDPSIEGEFSICLIKLQSLLSSRNKFTVAKNWFARERQLLIPNRGATNVLIVIVIIIIIIIICTTRT